MKDLGGLETTYSNILLRMKILKYNINQISQNGINVDKINKNFSYFRDDLNKICSNRFDFDAEENRPLAIELKKSLTTIANEFQNINNKANPYVSHITCDGQTLTLGLYFDLVELGIIKTKKLKIEEFEK